MHRDTYWIAQVSCMMANTPPPPALFDPLAVCRVAATRHNMANTPPLAFGLPAASRLPYGFHPSYGL
jgi:hypothetical protein